MINDALCFSGLSMLYKLIQFLNEFMFISIFYPILVLIYGKFHSCQVLKAGGVNDLVITRHGPRDLESDNKKGGGCVGY